MRAEWGNEFYHKKGSNARVSGWLMVLALSLQVVWGVCFPSQQVLAQSSNPSNPLWREEPNKPIIKYVTMDPVTGITEIFWEAPAKDPNCPEPTGYYLYKLEADGTKTLYKEFGNTTFTFRDIDAKANERPVSYVMASKGPKDPSGFTDRHTTMFARLNYDTCKDRVVIDWSPYAGWGNNIACYVIYKGETQQWGNLPEHDRLETASHTNYVEENILKNREYYYYIEVQHKTNPDLKTRSNLLRVKSRLLRIASKSQVDSIHCEAKRNKLIYTIDPPKSLSSISYYKVVRQENNSTNEGKLQAQMIDKFTESSKRVSYDSVDGSNTNGRMHYYYVATVDQCGEEVDKSPLLNSITVRVGVKDKLHTVSWDPLEVRPDHSVEYRVKRVVEKGKERKKEDLHIATLRTGEHSYVDDVSQFEGREYSDKFCYYIEAREIDPSKKTARVVVAYPNCVKVVPNIKIPNALDPMTQAATDGVPRNMFAPVSDFAFSYKLYIFNRAGEMIYTGDNQGWNGKLKNGTFAPEGAYIYRMEIFEEGKAPKVMTGSFMVVYPVHK